MEVELLMEDGAGMEGKIGSCDRMMVSMQNEGELRMSVFSEETVTTTKS